MADKSIMEEMLPMKISNWESIEYSEGICCPNPECDNDSWFDEARNILGWCETPSGFMHSVNVKSASPNTDTTELLAETNSTSTNSQDNSCWAFTPKKIKTNHHV